MDKQITLLMDLEDRGPGMVKGRVLDVIRMALDDALYDTNYRTKWIVFNAGQERGIAAFEAQANG